MKRIIGMLLIAILLITIIETPVSAATCPDHADGKHVFSKVEFGRHVNGKGHRKKIICSCGGWIYQSNTYYSDPSCSKCACQHSKTHTEISSLHQPGKGHLKSVYCNICGQRLSYSYVKLPGCSKCYPPLPPPATPTPPPVQTKISMTITGPLDALSSSGVMSIEDFPASLRINVNVENGTLKELYYKCDNKTTYLSNGSSIDFINDSQAGVYTITAESREGAVLTISVNVKVQHTGTYDIRYKTIGMILKTVELDENIIKSGLNTFIELDSANTIPQSEFNKIADLINRADGKTYKLYGSLIIEVRNIRTNTLLNTYDVSADFSSLITDYSWTPTALKDFNTMKNAEVSYQAPIAVNAQAVWCNNDKSVIFGTKTAQQTGSSAYIFPYETTGIFFASSQTAVPKEYEYHGLQWLYSPQGNGYENGSQPGLTSKSEIYNFQSPVMKYYFYFKEKVTSGNITVTIKDRSSNAVLSGSNVSCNGKSHTTNAKGQTVFSNVPFGSYGINVSKSGYYSNSGNATISKTKQNESITIYLDRIPTTGDITVTVKDGETNAKISNAYVSCRSYSGTTNSNGRKTFSNISFGSYLISVSKPGYYSSSISTSISLSLRNRSVTIYLTPIPTTDLIVDIQTFGDVKTDTDVIFNVVVYNDGDKDIKPEDNVSVTLTARGITKTESLIVPKNKSQIIPFKIRTPNSSGTMNLTAKVDAFNTVREVNEGNNTAMKSVKVYKPVIPEIPNPDADDKKPAGWTVPILPQTVESKRVEWSEWRYNAHKNSFCLSSFYVEAQTIFDIIPDPKIPTNSIVNGEHVMRSGYGVESHITVNVETNYDREGIITPAQRVWVYTPESSYELFRELDIDTSYLNTIGEFEPNKYSTFNSCLHFTPLWYLDGYYTMYAKAMDIWSPKGELYTTCSDRVVISGSVFDDWHICPIR